MLFLEEEAGLWLPHQVELKLRRRLPWGPQDSPALRKAARCSGRVPCAEAAVPPPLVVTQDLMCIILGSACIYASARVKLCQLCPVVVCGAR